MRRLLLPALLAVCACTPAPTIEQFSAASNAVPYARKASLSWKVGGATSLILEPLGPITGQAVQVEIREPTTFVLVARGDGGETRSEPLLVTPTPRSEAVGGTYNTGELGFVATLYVSNAQGAAPATAFTATLKNAGATVAQASCQAGSTVCLVRAPGFSPIAGLTVEHDAFGAQQTAAVTAARDLLLSQPGPIAVTALSSTQLEATWTPVVGAIEYRAQAFDLDTQALLGEPVVSAQPEAILTLPAPMSAGGKYGVWVEAASQPYSVPEIPSASLDTLLSRGVGARDVPGAYALFTAAQYVGDTLTVTAPALEQHEQLAAIVLNLDRTVVGRDDGANPPDFPFDPLTFQVTATGAGSPTAATAQSVGSVLGGFETAGNAHHSALHTDVLELNRSFTQRAPREPAGALRFAPQALTASTPTRTFCIYSPSAGTVSAQATTRTHETANAVFYVDNRDLADFSAPADLWTRFGSSWETVIHARNTSVFGAPSDVDNNGKTVILFTRELGESSTRGIVVGYFFSVDVDYPADPGSCANYAQDVNTTGNRTEVLYMNTITNLAQGTGKGREYVINTMIPGTLAHEFQHLINHNQRCPVGGVTCESEEVFINEGLSMIAEDLADFGWHDQVNRNEGGKYLDREPGLSVSHINSGLTIWSGDPIGNYQGSHAFFRYLWDRFGTSAIAAIAQSPTGGIPNLELNTLGVASMNRLITDWASALMFSNETFAPTQLSHYAGAWTPLHQKVGYVNWLPLRATGVSLPLRVNGWGAFLSGPGKGATLTLEVKTPNVDQKPNVVVVRFTGVLPRCADAQATQICWD